MIIGIDPGLKGGIAFLDDRGKLYKAIQMPNKTRDMFTAISSILYEKIDVHTVSWIEKSQPHRSTKNHKEGIMQIFSNGFNYGKIYGVLDIICGDHLGELNEVYPITWKSAFKLSKDKQKSIDLCLNLFPESREYIIGARGGKHDGMAEAILIAYYGYLEWSRRINKRFKTNFV